jgi:hypothetical protein
MSQGFYSLIQYCPDFSRAETANVGLMLFQVDPARTAVRVVDDVHPVMKRLGRKDDARRILGVVQSVRARIENDGFGEIEAVEKFVRTRGNQIQLTMPRPMHIEAIERDLEVMFDELVGVGRPMEAAVAKKPTLLQRTFSELAERLPARVFIGQEFHLRDLGIPVRSDYAYQNGRLNLVREMPRAKDVESLRFNAMGLSREGELVRHLEEGEGHLVVVSTGEIRSARAIEFEREFGVVIGKLGFVEFVPSAGVPDFARRIETELSEH